jgi:hypothetical protein
MLKMSRQKSELAQLYKILTNFCSIFYAADVDADTPLTCRCHNADVAADIAADVDFPERPESRLFNPGLMPGYRQKIAPQKRSWGFA